MSVAPPMSSPRKLNSRSLALGPQSLPIDEKDSLPQQERNEVPVTRYATFVCLVPLTSIGPPPLSPLGTHHPLPFLPPVYRSTREREWNRQGATHVIEKGALSAPPLFCFRAKGGGEGRGR